MLSLDCELNSISFILLAKSYATIKERYIMQKVLNMFKFILVTIASYLYILLITLLSIPSLFRKNK